MKENFGQMCTTTDLPTAKLMNSSLEYSLVGFGFDLSNSEMNFTPRGLELLLNCLRNTYLSALLK